MGEKRARELWFMVAIGQLAFSSLEMFGSSAEAREGITAFNEKRTPDFSPFRGGH